MGSALLQNARKLEFAARHLTSLAEPALSVAKGNRTPRNELC